MKLFLYEWRKLFQQRLLWLITAALLCINGILVMQEINGDRRGYTLLQVKQVYEALEPLSTQERTDWLQARVNWLITAGMNQQESLTAYPYSAYTEQFSAELSLLSAVYEQDVNSMPLEDYLAYIETQASSPVQSLLAGQSVFEAKNLQKTLHDYAALQGVSAVPSYSEAVRLVTNCRMTDVCLLLAFTALLLYLLLNEWETGVFSLLRPTQKGVCGVILAKAGVMLFLAFLLTGLFYGTNLLLAWKFAGLDHLLDPIQCIYGYFTCPYPISVACFLALFLLLKFSAVALLGSLLFLIAGKLKKTIPGLALYAVVLGLQFVLWVSIDSSSWLSILHQLNLFELLDTGTLFFLYQNLNLLGQPVSLHSVQVLSGAALFFLCIGFGIRCFSAKDSGHQRTISFPHPKRSALSHIHTSLFLHEGYKILVLQHGILILCLLLLIQGYRYSSSSYHSSPEELYYQQYSQTLAGIPDETKDSYLQEEEAELLEALEAVSANESANSAYAGSQAQLTQLRYEALLQAQAQYQTVCQYRLQGENVEYIDQTGWNALFSQAGQQENAVSAALMSAGMLLSFSALFSLERRTGMFILQQSSKRGERAVERQKFLWCLLLSLLLGLIAFLPRYVLLWKNYDIPLSGLSVHSVLLLSDLPGWITLPLWLGLLLALQLLGVLLSGGLVCLISRQTHHTVAAALLSTVVLLLPVCLYLWGSGGGWGLLPLLMGTPLL